jgi:hypothetical protein
MPTQTNYGLNPYIVDITSDGKILIAGYSLDIPVPNFVIAGLNANGALGTSFNSGLDTERSEMFNPMEKLLWLGLDETATNPLRKIALSLLPKILVTGT